MSFENGIRKTNKCLNPVAKKSLYNCIIRFKHKLNSPSISTMRLSQFNSFLSPLLLFWHFKCHNSIFSLFPPILAMRLPPFNFFFSLLSPHILVSVSQLGNRAWAKIWAENIFWQWYCQNYFSLLSLVTSFFFPLLLFLTISVTLLPKFSSLFTQLNNFE